MELAEKYIRRTNQDTSNIYPFSYIDKTRYGKKPETGEKYFSLINVVKDWYPKHIQNEERKQIRNIESRIMAYIRCLQKDIIKNPTPSNIIKHVNKVADNEDIPQKYKVLFAYFITNYYRKAC